MKRSNLIRVLIILVIFDTIQNFRVFGSNNNQEISGTVFEDSNNNSLLDPGERGIPGILMSNQYEIAETDEKGRYTLPVISDETIISLIKPAGYSVPLNEYNLPQFYYIHKPDGSPDLEYGGIEPTGDLPSELNFALQKTPVKDTFKVIVMADPQTRTIEEVNFLRDDIAAELIGTEALFNIALGDIMFEDLSLFEPYNAVLSMIDIPMYNVPGNHDYDHYSDTVHHTVETFKQHFGPDYYALEYGKVSFIVLNSVYWPEDQNNSSLRDYEGLLDEKQLKWIENYLKYLPAEQLLVFCMHIPLHSLNSDEPQGFISNRSDFFNLVKDRKHLLALSGHLHALENFYLDKTMEWTSSTSFQQVSCAAASGNWWSGPKDERGIPVTVQLKDGTPNGYHIFSFSGNTYSQRFKAASRDENYQMRISSPSGIIDRHTIDSVNIIINVFNGNTFSEVTYRIDNSPSDDLKKAKMKDPFAIQLFTENSQCYKEWMSVGISNHMWTGKLPSDLAVGMHKIIVNAKDEYGNEFRKASIFEIK